jgi:mRNA interferase MazF
MTTRHKIILISFPFDDLSATKVRPAVCLTNPIGPHRHVVFALITSQVSVHPLPTDLVLNSSDTGFGMTGLRVPSTIQLHRSMTGSTELIRRELGALPPRHETDLQQRLRRLFDLL